MSDLASASCKPCEKGTPPISGSEGASLLSKLDNWKITSDGKSLEQDYVLQDFNAAVELIKTIRDVAEAEDHHPDLHLTNYRNLKVVLSTHSIGGLSNNDFILAAKIDRLPKQLKASVSKS